MEENICRWSNQEGINLQNTELMQLNKQNKKQKQKHKRPNQKVGQRTK